MAFNNMNFWDDDPDERLRQSWQRTFADFEVQSRPSLRRRILSRAMARNRPKPMGWLAGGILLLLISTVLVYTVRRISRPALVRGHVATPQSAPASQSERVTVRQPVTLNRSARSSKPSEIGLRAHGAVAGKPQPIRRPVVSGTKIAGADGSSRHAVQPTNWLRLRTETNLPPTNSYRTGRHLRQSPRFSTTHSPLMLSHSVEASNREWAAVTAKNADGGTSPSVAESYTGSSQPATPAWPVVLARLNIPTPPALPSSLRALPNYLPASASVVAPAEGTANGFRRGNQWFVEAVPLSSFQWMRASAISTGYLTQVNAPAAFSPATWGYQINGGICWQRWQAYLSIGQLRRWAYYTVNENQYRMEPGPTSSYQLVRGKHVVVENVALPMVGGGLNQYRLLGHGRYRIELGSQVVYSPTDGQFLASLRGGASRRLPISRRLELQAGLLVEYGLNRLMNERQQLAIQPIVVGIGARIQPRLFSQK